MLRSLEKWRESFATSRPVKSVKISVVAVVDLGWLGDVLLEGCSQGSMATNLSSLLLTSNESDMPGKIIHMCQ
jgi:hypothetical protein